MNQRIGEQFVNIGEEIDGKLVGMQNDIVRMKRSSDAMWDKGPTPVRDARRRNSVPYPMPTEGNDLRDNASFFTQNRVGGIGMVNRGLYDQDIQRTPMFIRENEMTGIPQNMGGNHDQERNVNNNPYTPSPPVLQREATPNTHYPRPNRFSTPNINGIGNRNEAQPVREIHREKAKPRVYDGNEDFDDYLSQFEIVADLNNWDYRTKSLQLAGHLAKDACGILGELGTEQRRDYDTLVTALKRRFGATERSEMFRAKLKTRTRGNNESISELAQAIKKLTRQAYPSAESGLTDILALDQFIDALPDPDIRLRLREARPRDINEAETLAIRLETYRMADPQKPISNINAVKYCPRGSGDINKIA